MFTFIHTFKFPLLRVMRPIIFPECKTLLDVGCGRNSCVQYLKGDLKKSVGVEIHEPALEESRHKKIHDQYYLADASTIGALFKPKSFDCVIAIDVIEHIEKKASLKVIAMMESLAKKYVILQTPNGFMDQEELEGNKYQAHKSGFLPQELQLLGYRVLGLDGPQWYWDFKAHFNNTPLVYLFDSLIPVLDLLYRNYPDQSRSQFAYKKM